MTKRWCKGLLFALSALPGGRTAVRAERATGARAAARDLAFDGGWNLPMWAAQRKGLFEAQGVAVQLAYTPTSGFLVASVLDGKSDIAFAAVDNLIAYQEGQGEAKIPDNPDLVAFMGGDGGFLSVVAAPSITVVRGPQGQDGVRRRDDDRLRVRDARARRPQRPRGGRRQVTCARAAPRTATAILSPASTTRRCCARRSSCSRENRGYHVIATRRNARRVPGHRRARAAELGARARSAAGRLPQGYKAATDLARTTARIATSSRRCSSRTSAT